MSRRQCVVDWIEDPRETGNKRLVPVTCGDIRAALELIIFKLAVGEGLDLDEEEVVQQILSQRKEADERAFQL
jgi:hypothetical protein